MSNFGFPQSTNYAQSQVTSNQGGFDTNYTPVENGGLFTRDECRNLARYGLSNAGRSLRRMTVMVTESARPSKWLSGWWIATVP